MAEKKTSAEAIVRNIRHKTRRKYSAEEKIRIVLECIFYNRDACSPSLIRLMLIPSFLNTCFFVSGSVIHPPL